MARIIGCRATSVRAIVALLIILILYTTFHHSIWAIIFPSLNLSGIKQLSNQDINHLRSPNLVNFWQNFAIQLLEAKPNATKIVLETKANARVRGAQLLPRPDLIKMDDEELDSLKRAHARMAEISKNFAYRLPYVPGSRGVVMTAGGKYFNIAITSIRMLRRTGSDLPIELYLDSWDDIVTCERILLALNARCYVLPEIFQVTPFIDNLERFQFKAFAMLFSTFEDIIFLDADAFPAHSPDDLFDVDPYKTSGLVTFPDFWWSTTSPLFFRIAGMTEPSIRDRKTSESGILLLSKRINGHTLLLATYYNYYGPDYFYPLLSQGGIGQGDKETFLHAAMALGASFYDVKTPVKNIGAWINGTFFNAGMKQGDPVEDYSIHQAKTKAQNAGLEAAAPEADNRTKTFARSFFIHNNIYKLDVRHLSGNLAGWRNEPSHFVRLWGEKENNEHKFGYDIEKVLWEEVLIVACEFGREECEKSQAYIKEGFHE